jgi:plastocyanin
MFRPLFVSAIIALTALSGCLGGDDEDPSASPTGTEGSTGPGCCGNVTLTVVIINATTATNTSEPINVTWEVSIDGDVNSTDIEVEHTDVHWGNESVSDPMGTSAYPNQTDEQSGAPGIFNATFTIDTNGTYYVRAHAVLNGSDFWSEESIVQVNPGIPPLGEVHEVEIGALLPGQLAEYDPDPLTIKLGDGVKWLNKDRVAPHTATSDDGAPQAFDTGNLASGGSAESEVIQFTVAGEYTYHCSVHSSMSGTLTVEA